MSPSQAGGVAPIRLRRVRCKDFAISMEAGMADDLKERSGRTTPVPPLNRS
jgi:hypothetical protein